MDRIIARRVAWAVLSAALAAPQVTAQTRDHEHPHGRQAAAAVPLYDNLGDHHYGVTSANDLVQRYVDQGLRLYYAFNHQEAIRSFREAQRLDPACAMCWWGEALAWGPNINLPMDSAAGVAAFRAVSRARQLEGGVTERERALIEALTSRYHREPLPERGGLDRAYEEAMRKVVHRFPDDPETAVLFAEAVMTTRPWDYWTEDGQPREGIAEALASLRETMERNPNHPGACHFYIHAVEKLYPERAVACAERLAGLMPGAGHLVHMPGHIYIRVGRYLDAIAANEHAVHADETYIQDQRPGMGVYTAGYYPHNYDFLAFAASMVGRSKQGIAAARRVADVIPLEMMGEPGFTFLQHYGTRPFQLLVRFGRWDDILQAEEPPVGLTHARGMWHYARGRALAATGDPVAARSELKAVRAAASAPELQGAVVGRNPAGHILQIAERVLAGRIAVAEGRLDDAVDELTAGVGLEGGLLYGEPPEWTIPVRHDLGAVLLRAGRAAAAERVYREDLKRFPANGWSLWGLTLALRAQGREAEALQVEARFHEVWKEADVVLAESVF